MRGKYVLGALALLAFAGPGFGIVCVCDRVLVDVGICWDGGDDWPGFGPVASPASDGNYWNNFDGNPQWGFGPIDLVDVNNIPTGMTFHMSNWSGCGDGGQVNTSIAPVSNLYPEKAQTDCRWWDAVPGGMTVQPGLIFLAGLDTALTYDICLYGYVPEGAVLVDDGPYPAGTTVYTIAGVGSVELDVMNNTTQLACFYGVAPLADGTITIELAGGLPEGCGAVVNVVDICIVPEPATLLLLAAGAGIALRRRRG